MPLAQASGVTLLEWDGEREKSSPDVPSRKSGGGTSSTGSEKLRTPPETSVAFTQQRSDWFMKAKLFFPGQPFTRRNRKY